MALQSNIDLLRVQTNLKVSDQTLYQSRANFLPSINGYISQGQNAGKSINPFTNQFINQKIITGQYGLNGTLNLWNGFSNYNNMRQNAFSNKAFQMDVEQAKLDLILNIITLYLQALSNEETLEIALAQKELSQQQVDRLISLDKSGAIAPNILYDAKGQLANDKLNAINAKNDLDNSQTNLLVALNYQEVKPVKLEKLGFDETNRNYAIDALNKNALEKMPLIKASEYRLLSSRKNLQSSRGNAFPTLSLNASLGSNYSDAATKQQYNYVNDATSDNYILVNNTKTYVFTPQYDVVQQKIDLRDQVKNNLNSYIGLSLQVPILNSLRTKSQMGISRANYHYALAQNQNSINKLGLNIKQAYTNMIAAKERLETVKEQSEYYNESFKIATSKFEKGAITTVDYTFAKNNSNRSSLNQVVLKYDYILKLKTLEYYSGSLNF